MTPKDRLKLARMGKGYTQEQLADNAGKSRYVVLRLESGATRMEASAAETLAPHLGVSPEWLLYGIEGDGPTLSNPAVGKNDLSQEELFTLGRLKGHVSETVGFDVTVKQALEWLFNKAGVSDIFNQNGPKGHGNMK